MTIYVPNSGKWKSYKTEGQNREFLLEGIKEAMKIAKKFIRLSGCGIFMGS